MENSVIWAMFTIFANMLPYGVFMTLIGIVLILGISLILFLLSKIFKIMTGKWI